MRSSGIKQAPARAGSAAGIAVAHAAIVALALALAVVPAAALANTFHHTGESGGGNSSAADPDADCLRWEEVLVASDGAISDVVASDGGGGGGGAEPIGGGGAAGAGGGGGVGGAADAAGPGGVSGAAGAGGAGGQASPPDAGTTVRGTVELRCVEHATMFGCHCAAAGGAHTPTNLVSGIATIVVAAAMLLWADRARRGRATRRAVRGP